MDRRAQAGHRRKAEGGGEAARRPGSKTGGRDPAGARRRLDRVRSYYPTIAPELKKQRDEIAKLRRGMPKHPTTLVMAEGPAEHIRTTRLHKRGEFLRPAEEVKPGITHGATDELGFHVAEDPVHVHDLQATILHCLGFDHERLTYTHQDRPFRLTDVHGKVVKDLLA